MERYLEKKFGSWYYMVDDDIRYMADELAFCFDLESGTLYKHGPADQQWYEETRKKLKENPGLEHMTSMLTIVSASDWDTETVNKFIYNSTYIKLWYERNISVKT